MKAGFVRKSWCRSFSQAIRQTVSRALLIERLLRHGKENPAPHTPSPPPSLFLQGDRAGIAQFMNRQAEADDRMSTDLYHTTWTDDRLTRHAQFIELSADCIAKWVGFGEALDGHDAGIEGRG